MDKFSIINSIGQSYDVMPKGYNLAGFGYENQGSYSRVGNRYINTLEYFKQGTPQFSVLFPEATAEVDYFEFIKFLQYAPLKLMLSYDNFTFYRNIRINKVDKNWLPVELIEATITVACLTPPYKIEKAFNQAKMVEGGKVYDYTYNYTYTDGAKMTIHLDCDTNIDSPVKIGIYGPCENPVWNYYLNGQQMASGKINALIPEGRKVVIDTTQIPYSIKMFDLANNLIGDLYETSDFSTERFIHFRNGRNRVSVSQDNANDISLGLEAHIYYASV